LHSSFYSVNRSKWREAPRNKANADRREIVHARSVNRLCIVLGLLYACGDNVHPIERPSAPQVSSAGGPVLVGPEIVPIFFAGDDDMQHQLEAFLDELATSPYWSTATSEYGIGAPTIDTSIVAAETPPTTDDELQALLESHVGSPLSAATTVGFPVRWPAPDANTVYVVFLPTGVTLTAGSDTSCVTFGGYHDETTQSHIVYALLPRCAPSGAPIDAITPALSHELVEAATDPHPETAPAFVVVDNADIVWAFTPGAELGDMCEYVHAARQRLVGGYLVQRTWSNNSAAAGHDPCVPTLGVPYVGAAPVFGDVTLAVSGTSVVTQGIQIATNTSATIDLTLFSDAPTANWTVGADDVASVVQMLPAELSMSLNQTVGNDGDVLELTIKRLKNGDGGGSEFVITSKVGGETTSLWWGLVTN
jgi:hypothetical protein